jgi:hypothetical protein
MTLVELPYQIKHQCVNIPSALISSTCHTAESWKQVLFKVLVLSLSSVYLLMATTLLATQP